MRRHPWLFWSVAVLLAAATGVTVAALVGEASSRARELGGLRDVPVAARDVEAGHVLSPADVVMRRLPAASLPTAPVARSPAGHSVVVPVVAGEALLQAKLAPWGVKGAAALVPPGRRALAVPSPKGGLPVQPRQEVDVLATFDTTEGKTEPTFPVAVGALVVDVGEEAVTVAVTPEEAPKVAFATARATVTLALTSP